MLKEWFGYGICINKYIDGIVMVSYFSLRNSGEMKSLHRAKEKMFY
jgi:hypothetical protein